MSANTNTPEIVQDIIGHILKRADDIMFENFDKLHRRGIHDNDVLEALRELGENGLAERYIEWGDLIDPDGEPGPEDTPDVVPDPITADSYKVLREQTARTETF